MHRTAFAPLVVSLLLPITATAAPLPAPHQVFVTNESKFGNLSDWEEAGAAPGGVEAGNAICQKLAENAALPGAGDYRAWISDATTDAYCNVAGFSGKKASDCGELSLPDAGPWVLTNGAPFARSLQELTSANAVLWVPQVDQFGATLNSITSTVLTGTLTDGTHAAFDCGGWLLDGAGSQGQTGVLNAGTRRWTEGSVSTCDTLARLYCFESGAGDPLPRFAEPGAYAFVTSAKGDGLLGGWADAGGQSGITAGNEICRQAAIDGHLPSPSSFVAWLSDGSIDVKDRLLIDGPWRRPDGARIASSKTQLLTSLHESAIETDELGNHLSVYTFTGSGVNGLGTGDDCGDWLTTTGLGSAGLSSSASFFWSSGLVGDCDVPNYYHLFCLANVVTIFADSFESGSTTEWSAALN